MSQRLGDLLVKEKVITPEQLRIAMDSVRESGGRLGSVLVKLGYVSEEDVPSYISRQYGIPAINLAYFEVDPTVIKLIPYETAKRYQVLPLSRIGSSLTLAMVDPANVFALDDINFMTGLNIEPVVAAERAVLEQIEKIYGASSQQDLEQVLQEFGSNADSELELQAEE
jgi:type IV pilus assembly protein PilB